jgi:hypothetical protein
MPELIILIIVNILLVFLAFFYFRRKFLNLIKNESLLSQVREEIQGLIVELNQTTERNLSLTEERIRRLTDLLEKADKTIVLLDRETKKTERVERTYTDLKPKSLFHAPKQTTKEAGSGEFDVSDTSPDSKAPSKKSSREKVLELTRQGISPDIIASKLGKTIGEVELIISLGDREG